MNRSSCTTTHSPPKDKPTGTSRIPVCVLSLTPKAFQNTQLALSPENLHITSSFPRAQPGTSTRELNRSGDYTTRPPPRTERAHTDARIEHETLLQLPEGVTKLNICGGRNLMPD